MQLHADAGNAAGVEKVRLVHKNLFFLSNHYSSLHDLTNISYMHISSAIIGIVFLFDSWSSPT